ncbi:MAG: hypothetical protein JXQ23_04175 [Clostridia bacterium]|nr:hypothetical protein [Clostridia bacterium]
MSYNIEKRLESFKEIEIEPSAQLISKTLQLARAYTEQKRNRRRINWIPTFMTASLAVIAVIFAIITFVNLKENTMVISSETAAIYSLDINPSIEMGVDSNKEVIEVKSLNEDGKLLLKQVNCMGLDIKDCFNQLINKAVELGYISEDDINYVMISEIVVKSDFMSIKEEMTDVTKPESVKLVFLIGDIEDKETADSKGISIGKEIFQEKAQEIGISIKDSDLIEKSIKEVISNSSSSVSQLFDKTKTYTTPEFVAESHEGYIAMTWKEISDDGFSGYKIVISKNNAAPEYPADGYLVFITDTKQTSYLITDQVKYQGGDFGEQLMDNESYYITITAVYSDKNITGKAVKVKYTSKKEVVITPSQTPSPSPSPVVNQAAFIHGERLQDGTVNLTWDKIYSASFTGYKIVASATNENPKYPDDGYIKYITDKNINSLHIGNEFSGVLKKGSNYYFSVTVLYGNESIAGNSVQLKYMETKITPPPVEIKGTTITGERLSNGNIILGWDKIDDASFTGYKVVASATNQSPCYPEDGYITYITDRSQTSLLLDASYSGKLAYGTEYYFSITALYGEKKAAGNAIKLKYMDNQAESEFKQSVITGQRMADGSVLLSWNKIDDTRLTGYKVVASSSNPTPSYPEDGYIKWITDKNTTSLLVDSSFASALIPGTEYYFSITALYNDQKVKVPGNAVKLKYMETTMSSGYLPSIITGQKMEDGTLLLSWDKIENSEFSGYKIVASATNQTPSYPADGYIRWITDKNSTSLLVDSSFASTLTYGTEYYFSVTVLYNNQTVKIPGNAVKFTYMSTAVQESHNSSVISGQRLEDGSLLLTWDKIESNDFSGYKVVASATNSSPSYPNDGYISWITDKNSTSLLVNSSFSSSLVPGTEYYFSITVLYNNQTIKVPGNAIKLKYLDTASQSELIASTITGQRLSDGNILLSWDMINVEGFSGYKVVASATNPNPSYPADGYIRWITDKNVTSLLVDGSFSSSLTEGTGYYFSITVLYNSQTVKIPGNSVYLLFR